jgi:DNA-binding LacI/PurR family transcriptional regulator
MRDWTAGDPAARPTAFLCVGKVWEVAQAALELGVDIPGELSILSLSVPGPWPVASEQRMSPCEPDRDVRWELTGKERTDPLLKRYAPLRDMVFTSVGLPFRQMGRWAMEEVQRRLGRPDLDTRHEVFTGKLLPGNSVSRPGT